MSNLVSRSCLIDEYGFDVCELTRWGRCHKSAYGDLIRELLYGSDHS